MPISIALAPNNVDSSASNFVHGVATLTFPGSYRTGGDTLDFAQIADKLPSDQILQVFAESQNGNSGYYVAVYGKRDEQLESESLRGRRHANHGRSVYRLRECACLPEHVLAWGAYFHLDRLGHHSGQGRCHHAGSSTGQDRSCWLHHESYG